MARPLAFAGLLGAAVGVPYAVTNGPENLSTLWPVGPTQQVQQVDPNYRLATTPPNASAPEGPNAQLYASPAPLEGPVGYPLDQVLRWDIDKNWVYRHWARKSTGLGDPDLFGVRVPLVTGYGMTDIAGSLSYYFDRQGVLQRIRLYGRTADTSRLAHLMASRFGMTPRPAPSAGDQLYQVIDDDKVRGELRTRPEPVLWGSAPHASFLVEMEINRPGGPFTVQPKPLRLDLPGIPERGPQPPSVLRTAQQPPGQPVLPPRSVVPDRGPAPQQAAAPPPNPQAAASSASPQQPTPAGAPAQPSSSSLNEGPTPDIQKLDDYRDRFRWPG